MGDTSETNTKVLSRELFLGVVAIISTIRSIFANPVTYADKAKILKNVKILFALNYMTSERQALWKEKVMSGL